MSKDKLLATALAMLNKGLSVVPVFGKKSPEWTIPQTRLLAEEELRERFTPNGRGAPTGLALIIGPATWEKWPYLWILEIEPQHRHLAEPWLDKHLPGWREHKHAESGGSSLHVYLM